MRWEEYFQQIASNEPYSEKVIVMDKTDELDEWFDNYDNWYQIEPRLKEYEDFAWRIIEYSGFSTMQELKEAISKSSSRITNTITEAHNIFYSTNSVRHQIKAGKREHIALEMMRLCNNAFRLNFTIIEPALDKGEKFINGPKNKRNDALARIMFATMKDYYERFNKVPSARILWELLPSDGCIQEKDSNDLEIFWLGDNGKEKPPLNFKRFQERYTGIKRKLLNLVEEQR